MIGTITYRDIAIRLVAGQKPGSTAVEEILTREVVACRPQDDIQKAEQLMARNRKSRLMCTDDAGRLLGVISLSDIAQHDRGARASDTLRQVSEREARA